MAKAVRHLFVLSIRFMVVAFGIINKQDVFSSSSAHALATGPSPPGISCIRKISENVEVV